MKNNKKRIDRIAQRIHNEVETENLEFITWDDFCIKYIKEDLPKNKLQHLIWVNKRPRWIVEINNSASNQALPIYLDVVNGKGIRILTDEEVGLRIASKRTRKIANTIINSIEAYQSSKNSFPQLESFFDRGTQVFIDQLYAFYGRIEALDNLNPDDKKILKKIIESRLKGLE